MSASPGDGGRALLTVRDLTVTTRHRTLVGGVGFAMAPGERVGLIGESGSGKTLTALALMGLLPENLTASGSVRLAAGDGTSAGPDQGSADDGLELLGAPDRRLQAVRGRQMSMVFQEPLTALNPLMRVGRQVAEVMTIHGTAGSRRDAHGRAVELLAKVRLPDPAHAAQAYPHELSGGQRQRAMLAMALANNPALVLADEPTTALDVTVQRQVLDLMLDLTKERGAGLLFITHDLAVIANVCDRVLVMNDGRVVEEGTTEQVFTHPEHPYTRGLLAASDLDATDARGRLFTLASATAYVPPSVTSPTPTRAAAAGTEPDAGRPTARPVGSDGQAEEPIVVVRDLVRTYHRARRSLFGARPEIRALRGISFDVAPGERLGVVGESGSGKSTLLRILAGLDEPTSGSARVAGNEVAGAPESRLTELRRHLQIVFQDPMSSLDPRMTVEQIVAEPLRAGDRPSSRREQREAVREMLAAVGLPADSAERYPHQFSGGQRQRISIARALVGRPQVLVADEPVSALDVSVRAQVLNLIADLVEEYRLTLILVSHDLGVVRHVCDRVLVMHDGEIVEAGDTERVYTDPHHAYTRTLVGSSMSLRGELAARGA